MKISTKQKTVRLPFLITLAITALLGVAVFYVFFLTIPASAPAPKATTQKASSSTPAAKTLLLPGAKTVIPLPVDPSLLTRPDGQLILVNKATPIDLTYAPADLVLPEVPYRTDKSQEEVMVRTALAKPLKDMFASAKTEKIDLLIGSAYRSSKLQETYFNSYVAASGQAEAEKYSAHPGTSEHQLGLAVDLTTIDRVCYLVECFEETAAGKWLAANAHDYGFILRYPKGKTELTGYNYEPWHFRYTGVDVASAIYESGLTYEEAFPYLSGDKRP